MKTNQERKLSMYLVVKDLLSQPLIAAIIALIPNFNALLTNFITNVLAIQSNREVQELDRSGVATNKKELKDDLVLKTMDVVRKLTAYAINTGNSILAAEVHYTESDLRLSADTILRDECQVIYAKANTNLAALATYGVTAATLTALQTSITAFNVAIPKPRLGITTKKQATDAIDILFSATDAMLAKMDKLIEIVHVSQPVFYKNYTDARIIVDAGHSVISVRGIAKDKESLLPMSGVVVSVAGIVPDKKTTVKGYFQVRRLASGIYSFSFSKSGYKTLTVDVNVTSGERTELNVELERL